MLCSFSTVILDLPSAKKNSDPAAPKKQQLSTKGVYSDKHRLPGRNSNIIYLTFKKRLEHAELLLDVLGGVHGRHDIQNVEAHGLGQRAALAHGHDITLLQGESGGAVHSHVGMALLETAQGIENTQVIN